MMKNFLRLVGIFLSYLILFSLIPSNVEACCGVRYTTISVSVSPSYTCINSGEKFMFDISASVYAYWYPPYGWGGPPIQPTVEVKIKDEAGNIVATPGASFVPDSYVMGYEYIWYGYHWRTDSWRFEAEWDGSVAPAGRYTWEVRAWASGVWSWNVATASGTIDVVKVDKITQPNPGDGFCRNKDTGLTSPITFVAVTKPIGYESWINWSGGEYPATGSGGTFITQYSSLGTHTVTAKFCETDPGKSIDIVVFVVTARNVDVPDPIGAKAYYQVIPGSVVLDSATFAAPGTTQVKTGVSGIFDFVFDQTKLTTQYPPTVTPQMINLTVKKGTTSCNITFEASRVWKITPESAEGLMAFFPVEGVGWRSYAHKLHEVYHDVTYSISFSGKTIWVGKSTALLYEGVDYENLVWTEQHKYQYGGGSTTYQGMSPPTGPIIIGPKTESRESSADLWPPIQALKGIAKCTGLVYDYNGGIAFASPIVNSSVDRSIP
jgi:hypothetical protein